MTKTMEKGPSLRSYCEQRGFDAAQLSHATGIHFLTVYRILCSPDKKSRRRPSQMARILIGRALGIPPEQVLRLWEADQ